MLAPAQSAEGNGTALGWTARNHGSLSPETSDAFTVAPEVVYSPIVPAELLATKRLPLPSSVMPYGSL